mgnify:CR=1 FL=1
MSENVNENDYCIECDEPINRRQFSAGLLAAGLGLVLDPEKLLWIPGRKMIFIPPQKMAEPITDSLMGIRGGVPVFYSDIKPGSMSPLKRRGDSVFVTAELRDGRHLSHHGSTIFAVPGGKLSVQIAGRCSVDNPYCLQD